MVAEQSMLAGINGKGPLWSPPPPKITLQVLATVLSTISRQIAEATDFDFDTVFARLVALPDAFVSYFETPAGWNALASILMLDHNFHPVVH